MTLVPGYPAVMSKINAAEPVLTDQTFLAAPPGCCAQKPLGLTFSCSMLRIFSRVRATLMRDRTGAIGRTIPSASRRFAKSPRALRLGNVRDFRPDIVHGHDWQAGLTAAYLTYDGRPRPATVHHDP